MGKDMIKSNYYVYLEMYQKYLTDKNENHESIKNRKSTIKKFLNYLCEFDNKPEFSDIQRVHVEGFINVQEQKCLPNTVKRYFSFLKEFFMFCKKENINNNSIFENWVYKNDIKTESIFLSNNEIENLFNTIHNQEVNEKSKRMEIALLILAYTGCTKDELCSLNVYKKSCEHTDVLNYVSIENRTIYFGRKSKGNKINRREIILIDCLMKKILQYLKYMEDVKKVDFEKYPFLFISTYDQEKGLFARLTSSIMAKDIKHIVEKSTMIQNKKVSFQSLRNTFIKNLINDNVPLQVIRDLTGLDISSLKRYMDIEQYEKSQKETILRNKHPFKIVFDKL